MPEDQVDVFRNHLRDGRFRSAVAAAPRGYLDEVEAGALASLAVVFDDDRWFEWNRTRPYISTIANYVVNDLIRKSPP